MYQFGELLTLGLSAVTLTYVLANRRTIRDLPTLRSLVIPFLLLAVASLATVLEGLPVGASGKAIIFWEPSAAVVEHGGWLSQTLNLIEHLAYTGAAVALAVLLWRRPKTRTGADA